MDIVFRVLGLSLLVFALAACAMMGGRSDIYIDFPGLVFVLGILSGGMLVTFRPGQMIDALAAAVGRAAAARPTPRQRQVRVAVFGRAYQCAWGAGLTATLFGLVAMLADLSDPMAIGTGISAALLTTCYGALLAEFVFAPLQQAVMLQPTDTDHHADTEARPLASGTEPAIAGGAPTGLWRGVSVVAVLIAVFLVLVVSFPEIEQTGDLGFDPGAAGLKQLDGVDETDALIELEAVETMWP